jgi:EVE domain
MPAWLGVVSAEHVARSVSLGIVQTNHGKRSGVTRMSPGDGMVYYSPQVRLGEPTPLRAFTAVGVVADGEIWQVDEGDFRPFRRRVTYVADAGQVPISALQHRLQLTSTPNWGYQLRRGLVTLSDDDFETIRSAMTSGLPQPSSRPQPSGLS